MKGKHTTVIYSGIDKEMGRPLNGIKLYTSLKWIIDQYYTGMLKDRVDSSPPQDVTVSM